MCAEINAQNILWHEVLMDEITTISSQVLGVQKLHHLGECLPAVLEIITDMKNVKDDTARAAAKGEEVVPTSEKASDGGPTRRQPVTSRNTEARPSQPRTRKKKVEVDRSGKK